MSDRATGDGGSRQAVRLGPAPLLVVPVDPEITTPNLASVMEAYAEAGEAGT